MKDIKKPFEEKRTNFLNEYKKQKTINIIVLIVALVIVLVFFIVFRNNMVPALVVAFIAVVGLFAYTQVIKKKLNDKTTKYINDFYSITSESVLSESGFDNLDFIPEMELSRDEVQRSEIMKEINYVKSRNVHVGKVNDRDIRIADLLFKVQVTPKESKVAFCGKFIQVDLDKMLEEKMVMYLKPATEAMGPNMLDGLELVEDNDKYAIYSSDKKFVNSHKKLIKAFSELQVNEYILDCTVTFLKDEMTIAISCSDNIMVVPLFDELNEDCFVALSNALKVVRKMIDELDKKKQE